MHGSKTISVVLPAYNEERYIRPAVDDFFVPDVVDEVIVVDNNSRDRTAEEARQTRARVVHESKQGYGHGPNLGRPTLELELLGRGDHAAPGQAANERASRSIR